MEEKAEDEEIDKEDKEVDEDKKKEQDLTQQPQSSLQSEYNNAILSILKQNSYQQTRNRYTINFNNEIARLNSRPSGRGVLNGRNNFN